MSDGIYAAVSGSMARAQELEVVANNLANANTSGFRSQSLVFREVLAQQQTAATNALDISQTSIAETTVSQAQGAIRHTARPLDVALDGPGYFVVRQGEQTLLTRNGHFSLNAEGKLACDGGALVQTTAGEVTAAANARVQISEDGDVAVNDEVVGRLLVAATNGSLTPMGGTLLKSNESTVAATNYRLKTESLESSNTNLMQQMTDLITLNRAFDATMKVIDNYKQIDSQTAREMAR